MVKTAKAFKFAIWLATLVALVTFVTGLAEAKKGGHGPKKPTKQTCDNRDEFTPPIQMGVSGGNENDSSLHYCCSGTLGALVEDTSGNYYILSNNHILASTNSDDPSDYVIQPGLVDIECDSNKANVVGTLTEYIDIHFCDDPPDCESYEPNHVDAAIAAIIPGNVDTSGEINCIGNINPTPAKPYFRMRVQKSGRTSGLTKGYISSVDADIIVEYYEECGFGSRIAWFEDQIMIKGGGFSKPGDSGSLVVTTGRCPQPVGLLFAGGGPYTFANPIDKVLELLLTEKGYDLNIVGSCQKTGASEVMHPSGKALGLAKAKKVKKRHQDALLRVHGVVGVGVGVSKTGLAPRIEVYVVKDTPKIRREVPDDLEGIPVRIVETGVIHAL